MFHILIGFGSNLIVEEIVKFNVKISVIPNGLENCMDFQLIEIWIPT